jgi:phage-related protein
MEIKFWENKSKRAPVFEFIERQQPNEKQRIMKSIDHFAEQGMNLLFSPTKMKNLNGHRNLYELRIDFKGMFYRIIFCIIKGVAYLLTAFKKKANNTPIRHIKTALIRQQSLA